MCMALDRYLAVIRGSWSSRLNKFRDSQLVINTVSMEAMSHIKHTGSISFDLMRPYLGAMKGDLPLSLCAVWIEMTTNGFRPVWSYGDLESYSQCLYSFDLSIQANMEKRNVESIGVLKENLALLIRTTIMTSSFSRR